MEGSRDPAARCRERGWCAPWGESVRTPLPSDMGRDGTAGHPSPRQCPGIGHWLRGVSQSHPRGHCTLARLSAVRVC